MHNLLFHHCSDTRGVNESSSIVTDAIAQPPHQELFLFIMECLFLIVPILCIVVYIKTPYNGIFRCTCYLTLMVSILLVPRTDTTTSVFMEINQRAYAWDAYHRLQSTCHIGCSLCNPHAWAKSKGKCLYRGGWLWSPCSLNLLLQRYGFLMVIRKVSCEVDNKLICPSRVADSSSFDVVMFIWFV